MMSEAAEQRTTSWMSRRNLCAATAIVFLVAFLLTAGPSWAIALARLLSDGLVVTAWLLAAAGYGNISLRVLVPHLSVGPLLRCCMAIALGIGVMGFITVGLGLPGLLSMLVGWLIIAAGAVLLTTQNLKAIRDARRSDFSRWLRESCSVQWLPIVIAGALVAITSIAVFAPPGLLWGDEPNGYDVVEYHLQIPREWYEAHRIAPLGHNVFSYFPQGMEMHLLLAMHLCGGPWAGMYVAQLMHATTIGLVVLSVIAIVREQSVGGGAIAGAAMISAPWLLLLAPVAYVEGLMLLSGTLAIGLVWRAMKSARSNREWLLAGIFAGLACGAKLTAGPMIVAAVPCAVIVATAFVDRSSIALRRLIVPLTLFVVAALLTLSPWLIRDFVWTRNPVFPEMTSVFGNGNGRLSADQIERWRRANHEPAVVLQSIGGHLSAAVHQIILDWRYGFILLPIACTALIITRSRRDAVFLGALLSSMAIFWAGFTHLQSRFFVLAIPVAAIAIGSIELRNWRRLVSPLLAIAIITGVARFWVQYSQHDKVLDVITAHSLIGIEKLDGLADVDLAEVPADRTVALVGDAKAFLYSRPMSRLRYRTVFDAGSSPDDWLHAWVGDDPDSLLAVSPADLRRMSGTYWKVPSPPDEVASRGAPFILRR